MRAVVATGFGGPEKLVVVDRAEPVAADGEIVVRVEAAGVNFRDVMMRRGAYPSLPTPPVPMGCEGAGVIVGVGGGVEEFAPGDRVAWAFTDGSYAELVAVPAAGAVRVPDTVPASVAGAVLSQGLTAHYLATAVGGPPAAGDSALVLSAAGGVGRLLTQILTLRGIRVIAVVSEQAKVEPARDAGATEVIVGYEGVASAARKLNADRGVDVVYDGVGGAAFASRLSAVRRRGAVVLYGASGGEVPPLDLETLAAAGSITLCRPGLADFIAERAELEGRVDDLFEWVATGQLDVAITGAFALDEAVDVHRLIESRSTTGKLIIIP